MRHYIFFFLLFVQTRWIWSQSTTPTSLSERLKQELAAAETDTQRVMLYLKFMQATPDKKEAIEFGQQGYILARRIQFEKGAIECGLTVGANLVELDYYRAVPLLTEVKQLCEKKNSTHELVKALGYLGYAYNKFDFEKARYYYTQCKQLMIKNKTPESVFPITTVLGQFYKNWGLPDSALYYLQKGYQLALQTNLPMRPEGFYVPFGIVYYQKKMPKLAMDYFRRYIAATNDQIDGQAYQGIALIYRDRKQLDSARFYARKSLEIQQKKKHTIYVIESADLLFDLYKNNDPAQALHYHLIASAAKDSLFNQERVRQVERVAYEEQEREERIKRRIEANRVAFQNQLRLYFMLCALGATLLGAFFLYRNNRQKQKANALLNEQKQKVEQTLSELRSTQDQLIQSEKLAGLGELTAGIAHEIQNPLNFVNNFSEVSGELVMEMEDELKAGNTHLALEIMTDVKQNLAKIHHHGKRASSIVKGMLEHSRISTGERQLTDLNAICDEYLRLAYHGMKAKNKSFECDFELLTDPDLPKINIVPQDIGRVVLNLLNNAFYAVAERAKQEKSGYQPKVRISTKIIANQAIVQIKDNGIGISKEVKEKIFQPFFTTKPTGEGTGLGLSLAYDIVTKGHGGTMEVETKQGEGTTFIIKLPI